MSDQLKEAAEAAAKECAARVLVGEGERAFADIILPHIARVESELYARIRRLEQQPRVAEDMVNRFLNWPIPKSVLPDACVMNRDYPNRVGTNLLTAEEARQMLEYVLQPARSALPAGDGPSALALIANERERQVKVEGWGEEHDDEHERGELAMAASAYALPMERRLMPAAARQSIVMDFLWPWTRKWWKPTPNDRVRELVKAGALIVAEIERLQRRRPLPPPPSAPAESPDVATTPAPAPASASDATDHPHGLSLAEVAASLAANVMVMPENGIAELHKAIDEVSAAVGMDEFYRARGRLALALARRVTEQKRRVMSETNNTPASDATPTGYMMPGGMMMTKDGIAPDPWSSQPTRPEQPGIPATTEVSEAEAAVREAATAAAKECAARVLVGEGERAFADIILPHIVRAEAELYARIQRLEQQLAAANAELERVRGILDELITNISDKTRCPCRCGDFDPPCAHDYANKASAALARQATEGGTK